MRWYFFKKLSSRRFWWLGKQTVVITFIKVMFCRCYFFALREKYPDKKFFVVLIFLRSAWIQENTDQKKSLRGHFSCNVETYFHALTRISTKTLTWLENQRNVPYIDMVLSSKSKNRLKKTAGARVLCTLY